MEHIVYMYTYTIIVYIHIQVGNSTIHTGSRYRTYRYVYSGSQDKKGYKTFIGRCMYKVQSNIAPGVISEGVDLFQTTFRREVN